MLVVRHLEYSNVGVGEARLASAAASRTSVWIKRTRLKAPKVGLNHTTFNPQARPPTPRSRISTRYYSHYSLLTVLIHRQSELRPPVTEWLRLEEPQAIIWEVKVPLADLPVWMPALTQVLSTRLERTRARLRTF
jgi:hypothetical protein